MGFFSCACPGCNQSFRSKWSVNDVSSWMKDVVLLSVGFEPEKGEYDGYGRVIINGNYTIYFGRGEESTTLYHQVCWNLLDCPTEIVPNESARDQGYFVGEFHPAKPKYRSDLDALKTEEHWGIPKDV